MKHIQFFSNDIFVLSIKYGVHYMKYVFYLSHLGRVLSSEARRSRWCGEGATG